MEMFDKVKSKGGIITSFVSWCGGLPAPEVSNNPLGYKFSWSPKGVLLAGLNSAKFKRDGREVANAFKQTLIDLKTEQGKFQKEVKTNEERIAEVSRTFWETTHDTREEFDRRFKELERDISSEFGKNERNIYSEFEKRDRDLDSRFKDICDEINHTRSYIDSRIDKVTGTLGAKQVIKG
jgi:predicted transposase YbfD/YdcC